MVVRASPARPDPTITRTVTSSAPITEIGSARAGRATAHPTVPRVNRTARTSSALCRASGGVVVWAWSTWARQGSARARKAVQGSQARGLYQCPPRRALSSRVVGCIVYPLPVFAVFLNILSPAPRVAKLMPAAIPASVTALAADPNTALPAPTAEPTMAGTR